MAAEIPTGPEVVDKMKVAHAFLGDAIEKAEDGKVDLGELVGLGIVHGPAIAALFGVNIPTLGN